VASPVGVGTSGSLPEADRLTSSAAEPLAELERRSIAEALTRAKGNKSRAAALGLTRTQLYTRLRRFGLS
jgi:transcriptional regulator of acetoin/glycerol metabolism